MITLEQIKAGIDKTLQTENAVFALSKPDIAHFTREELMLIVDYASLRQVPLLIVPADTLYN